MCRRDCLWPSGKWQGNDLAHLVPYKSVACLWLLTHILVYYMRMYSIYIIIPWLPLLTQPAAAPRSLLNYIVVTLNVILPLCLCFTCEICTICIRMCACPKVAETNQSAYVVAVAVASGKQQCKQQHWDSCGRLEAKACRLTGLIPGCSFISGMGATGVKKLKITTGIRFMIFASFRFRLPASFSSLLCLLCVTVQCLVVNMLSK